jgi:hypothetical protein
VVLMQGQVVHVQLWPHQAQRQSSWLGGAPNERPQHVDDVWHGVAKLCGKIIAAVLRFYTFYLTARVQVSWSGKLGPLPGRCVYVLAQKPNLHSLL